MRSIYDRAKTLVTVGYGDFPFGDQPTALRIFDILLMLVGAALVAILFAQTHRPTGQSADCRDLRFPARRDHAQPLHRGWAGWCWYPRC